LQVRISTDEPNCDVLSSFRKLRVEPRKIWHESELVHTFGRDAQNRSAIGDGRPTDRDVVGH